MAAHEGAPAQRTRTRTDSQATMAAHDEPQLDDKADKADELLGLEGATATTGKKDLRFWLVFACLLLATFNAAVEQTGASLHPSSSPSSPHISLLILARQLLAERVKAAHPFPRPKHSSCRASTIADACPRSPQPSRPRSRPSRATSMATTTPGSPTFS